MPPPIRSAQLELPPGDRREFASLPERVAEMRGSSCFSPNARIRFSLNLRNYPTTFHRLFLNSIICKLRTIDLS